jgi:hypothetical protein
LFFLIRIFELSSSLSWNRTRRIDRVRVALQLQLRRVLVLWDSTRRIDRVRVALCTRGYSSSRQQPKILIPYHHHQQSPSFPFILIIINNLIMSSIPPTADDASAPVVNNHNDNNNNFILSNIDGGTFYCIEEPPPPKFTPLLLQISSRLHVSCSAVLQQSEIAGSSSTSGGVGQCWLHDAPRTRTLRLYPQNNKDAKVEKECRREQEDKYVPY